MIRTEKILKNAKHEKKSVRRIKMAKKCPKGKIRRDGRCVIKKSNSLMNYIPTRFPKFLIYVVGAFLEVVGFGLLFAFDTTTSIINKFPIMFSLMIIFSGYVLAIGARRK